MRDGSKAQGHRLAVCDDQGTRRCGLEGADDSIKLGPAHSLGSGDLAGSCGEASVAVAPGDCPSDSAERAKLGINPGAVHPVGVGAGDEGPEKRATRR